MRFRFWALAVAVLAATFAPAAMAGTLLVDRGLPSTNLNNAAGSNRSNVTWAGATSTEFTGDDFTIGTAGKTYLIDSITVWGAQYNPLQLDITNIWLYVGKSGDPLALLETGAVTGNTNSNPNISHKFVNYPDGTTFYEGNGAVQYEICETTFSSLNYLVEGGVTYNFGVRGDSYLWWNHASNASLSGTPQNGADDRYLVFDTSDLSSVVVIDSMGYGWDKSSDINVRVTGTAVPLPAGLWTGMALLGALLCTKSLRRLGRQQA